MLGKEIMRRSEIIYDDTDIKTVLNLDPDKDYINEEEDIEYICPKHGKQKRKIKQHLEKKGCFECQYDNKSKKTKGKDLLGEFYKRFGEDVFDYPDIEEDRVYSSREKIKIVCFKHGEFTRQIREHNTKAKICDKCKLEDGGKDFKKKQFKERLRNENYEMYKITDFSETVFEGLTNFMYVRCKKHDTINKIQPRSLLSKNSNGCSKCRSEKLLKSRRSNNKVYNVEDIFNIYKQKGNLLNTATKYLENLNLEQRKELFLMISKHNFGNKYDYSLIEKEKNNFKSRDKVTLICKEHNVEFKQNISHHYKGRLGCDKCKKDNVSKSISDSYRFSKRTDIKPEELIKEVDNENFKDNEIRKIVRLMNFEDKGKYYRLLGKKIKGDKYNYDKLVYNGDSVQVTITCKKHGDFKQVIYDHFFQDHNCNKCSKIVSKQELKLSNDLEKYFTVKNSLRRIFEDKRKEIDIFIKDINLGIEINGLRWHSNDIKKEDENNFARYHQFSKMNESECLGIKLLNFYDDEINIKKNEISYSKIMKEILLFNNSFNIKNIDLKDLEMKKISYNFIKKFYKKHSLEFFNEEDKNYRGIFYKGYIVSVFSFNNKNECHNYSTNYNLNEDIDLILDAYPNTIFNIRSDSYNRYKFQDYGFITINKTLPQYRNFNKKGLTKNRYKRLEKRDTNNPNRIYDCGRTIMIY
ncbi:hypothetical protein [Staphylococcus phage S6]|nr:hypothetical protein [Staphylococcus phage S6]